MKRTDYRQLDQARAFSPFKDTTWKQQVQIRRRILALQQRNTTRLGGSQNGERRDKAILLCCGEKGWGKFVLGGGSVFLEEGVIDALGGVGWVGVRGGTKLRRKVKLRRVHLQGESNG